VAHKKTIKRAGLDKYKYEIAQEMGLGQKAKKNLSVSQEKKDK